MKNTIFAAITAFLLSLTPLTAHAGAILVEPEEAINLEDYTTSYTALKEAEHIMFSGNQVLIHLDLPVMTEGCVITPNTMEWEVSGTADVTFETDSFLNSVSYEENYANTYCLITANSPGSVHVIGTEYSHGTEFYFNFTVGEDGNFDESVTYDNPLEPIISEDSVYFPKLDISSQFDLIVSSNLESTAVHDNDGCTFTPEEDGRYVVSTRAYCEEIVGCGTSDVPGHFHYFYPVLHNYVVIVSDGEIRVNHWGDKSWYSEEQVSEEVTAIDEALSSGDIEVLACFDVYAADPDDVMDGYYFSFVNGQLPDGTNGYDSYITNVYTEYGTDSYFCVNYFYSDVATTIPVDRVIALEQDISSLETIAWTTSWGSGDLDETTDDYMEFSRISAPEADGDLTVIVDGTEEYLLTVENGIFHHRKETSDLMGDCSGDGIFSVTDIIMLQKYLLCAGNLTIPQNADMCADRTIDAFDLAVMKRDILQRIQNAEPMLVVVDDQIYEIDGWTSKTFVKVLDTEGFWHMQESDTDLWDMDMAEVLADASAMIQDVAPSGNLTDAERDETQTFLDTVPQYEGTKMTAWGNFAIADYGQENLYAVYPDGNGGYLALELCRFGGECAWLDNAEVQAFVTMLIENGYYADADFFSEYLANYTE